MKITLCGSTRFWDKFQTLNKLLTLDGHTVYTVAVGKHDKPSADDKLMLDAVHMCKIANSDMIVVINEEGYIGESTRREIYFAMAMQKKVAFLRPDIGEAFELRKREPAHPDTAAYLGRKR